jgi:hypothetical protein
MGADFTALRRQIAGLGIAVRELRQRIELLTREREDLASAPPARGDVLDMLNKWLDEQAAQCGRNLSVMLGGFLRRAVALGDAGEVRKTVTLLGATKAPDVAATPRTADVVFIGLLLPELRRNLPGVVEQIPWMAPEGLPLAQRAERLRALDEQIATLEGEEAELVAQAASAGIVVDRYVGVP